MRRSSMFGWRLARCLALSLTWASASTHAGATESAAAAAVETEASCLASPQAIWVSLADGGAGCFDWARSDAGGGGPFALVDLTDGRTDAIERIGAGPLPASAKAADSEQSTSIDRWSQILKSPVVLIGRRPAPTKAGPTAPSTDRRVDVDLMSAALDQLKERLEVKGFHLMGLAAAGNLAATLALRRPDIHCTVMAGAWLSERDRLAETGETFRPATLRATNDPLAEIDRLRPRDGLRFIDLIDPTDLNTPQSALDAFAAAAQRHGVGLERIMLPALTSAPQRNERAMRTALACATGKSEADVATALRPDADAAPTPAPGPVQRPIGELILPQSLAVAPPPVPRQPTAPQLPAPTLSLEPVEPQIPQAPLAIKPEQAAFSRAALLTGTMADAATCLSEPFAVWVTSVGTPECIRYYYSDIGGIGPRALVFLNGDFTYRGADGQPTVDADYARLTPADLQHVAEVRSLDFGGPMIYLARPGTLGSSGFELRVRHTPREVALVAAALAEIKRRHGIATFDLIGHSGGGLLVGALVAERGDIGCAVSSSGVLATNAWTSQRLNLPPSNSGFLYDPLAHVGDIRPGPNFRYILLTDAADTTVSAASTQLYLDALAAAGIPHLHVALTAADDAHHDLALHGFRAAIACAHGMPDTDIVAVLTRTIVTNRRMSELSPLGDMPAPSPEVQGTQAPASPH